jgi:glycosyltransferase involved in cell wall biosynthesis
MGTPMDTHFVSVALCTYNGSAFLREQLQSVANQTRPPDELIICDDNSTDQTPYLLDEFRRASSIPTRIRINPTNSGTTRNFEQGFSLCRGDLIFPADQDDVWIPDKIERFVAAFDSPRQPIMVFSDANVVDAQLRRLDYRLWESIGFSRAERSLFEAGGATRILLRHNVVTGAAMAFRRSACSYVLPIDAGWVHDAWIALLLSATGICMAVDRPLIDYRQHGNQQIGATRQSRTQQVSQSMSLPATHYRDVARRYVAARERLQALQPRTAAIHAAVQMIGDKVAHLTARADLLDGTMPRLRTAMREWLSGRYRHYSLGFQSLARDLLRR